jgi:hypothetical protein
MWFRRQVDAGAKWVSVAQVGATLHAAQVCLAPGQRPRLQWLWQAPSAQLAEGLRALGRGQRLGDSRLVAQFDRSQYRLVTSDVPDVPREEWCDAMRWRLKDQIDFPVDDALIDILGVPQDTQLRQTSPVMAFVAQRAEYNRMALTADDLGLGWSAIEVPESALRNLSALAETEDQAHALMVFGESYGMLVITYRGELLMTRNIEVAISAVTGSVEARGAALGRAALEVLRTLDTFERMHSQVTLAGLSVVPPEGGEEVLEVLADLVYVPVKGFELSAWVDLDALGEQSTRMAASPTLDELCAIGAALRGYRQSLGLQQLNWLEGVATSASQSWSARLGLRVVAAVGGVAALAGLGMSSMEAHSLYRAQRLEADVASLRQAMVGQSVPPEFKEIQVLQALENRQRQMRDALQGAASPRAVPYSEYLLALSRQAQPGLWITGFTLRERGADLALSGRMTDPALLPLYLARLEQEEHFRGRRFSQVEMKSLAEEGVTSGVVEFSLRGKPPKTDSAQTRKEVQP